MDGWGWVGGEDLLDVLDVQRGLPKAHQEVMDWDEEVWRHGDVGSVFG